MKQKLLIVSLNIPYPLTHGGAIAQYYFLEKLCKQFDIIFCTEVKSIADENALRGLNNNLPLLKIYSHKNFPAEEGKVKRTVKAIINLFEKVKGKKEQEVVKGDDFRDDAYFQPPLQVFSKAFVTFLHDVIAKENITFVQLEFYETISLLLALPKHIKKVFVHHEVRTKRFKLSAAESSAPVAYKDYFIKCNELVEFNLLKHADKIVVFNKDDEQLLLRYNRNVVVSPFGIPEKLITRSAPSAFFNRFIFIGGEYHNPNFKGLQWFLDEVYVPNYNQIDWSIYVIGEWSDTFRNLYSKYPKIIFKGLVPDLDIYYENAVLLSSVFSGSGLRTKILHAFANKVPVMSTAFACEGLYDSNGINNHISIFDSAKDFLHKYQSFIDAPQSISTLAVKGCEYYNHYFSEACLVDARVNIVTNAEAESSLLIIG